MTERQLQSRPVLRDAGPQIRVASRPPRRTGRMIVLGVLVVLGLAGLAAVEDPGVPPVAVDGHTNAALGASGAAEAPSLGAATAETAPLDVPDDTGDLPVVNVPQVTPLATLGSLRLVVPAPEARLIGFHEASLPGVLDLDPAGILQSNDNTTRFVPGPDDPTGQPYVVLSSRGRVHGPSTAVDVVIEDDQPILSPVDGVVTDVRDYQLYSRYPDTRIEIQPDAAPHLRIVMIHVTGVTATAGDRVVAGRSILAAGPNRFSFSSHIDRYLDPERWPHVHIEVKDPTRTQSVPE